MSDLTKTDLTGSKLVSFEKLESGDYADALWIVEDLDFMQQAADGYLKIKVPGNDTIHSYKAKFVEAEPNGNMAWFGESLVSPDHWGYGYASFIIQDGDLLGHFTTETGAYSLHSIGDGQYVLVEYEDDGVAPICGMQAPNDEDEHDNQPPTQDRSSNCDVKVLVLYTSAALSKAENIDLGVKGFIAQANHILRNSQIYHQALTFFLAGHELLPGFVESNSIGFDLEELTASTSLAHARRDALNADCVVLLTDGDCDNALGLTPSCGPSVGGSFSIVQIDAAGPWKTFTHELAHQFGCKHSTGNSNGACEPVSFEQPHWFRCGGRDRYTVMEAGIPKKKDRISYFSNPSVNYHGHDLGTATRDNAAWLRAMACTVSGYRISEDMSAYIYGESQVCMSKIIDPAIFVAIANGGGPGPYTYAWQTAINGYTFSPILSTTHVLTLDLSSKQPGDVVFIRVTVTSAYQQVVFAYFSVFIIEDTPECLYTKPLQTKETLKDAFSFQAQPNPADKEVNVVLNAKESSLATIELLNLIGQVFSSTSLKTKFNERVEVSIKTSDLPTGTYLIRVTSGDNTEVKKVTIVH
ncbi:MAG: zinc-dependent metalloprotease [Saprospiraceae bacterium]|nr:zinc-dependent metalloprotease [Saprospiraceae bacterium]